MVAGLVQNTGPTLNVPVQDSKDRNSETPGKEFSNLLDSKTGQSSRQDENLKRAEIARSKPEKSEAPSKAVERKAPLKPESRDVERRAENKPQASPTSEGPKVERASVEDRGRAERRDDTESRTDGPPDPKVMDPRTSALRAKRDQAIRKFMDSFEGEFGVPPEEMVVAMSQLTAQDLDMPPEKTVDSLMANLQLNSQDELKAKKMYLGLLMQLKQIDTTAAMPLPQDNLLSQLQAQRIQLSSEKKNIMANQVQNLSDKFWMRGSFAEKAEVTVDPNQLQAQEFLKKMVTAESAGLETVMPPQHEAVGSTDELMKQLKIQNFEKSQAEEGEEGQVRPEINFSPETAAMSKSALAMKAALGRGQENLEKNPSDQNQLAAMLNGKQAVSQEAIIAEFKKMGIPLPETSESQKPLKPESEMLLNADLKSLAPLRLEQLTAALAAAPNQAPVEMTPAQKEENVQQIMNQAQVLLKKGGGEVKVEMSPEGMGSIQMRLQVLDGKVQLQMNTETKEAKKLIESSMQDLKQSLAAHQLSMDLVKVDVVNQTNSSQNAQNEMQNQMQNFLNQQQRDGTRQFWQQFNENFGNRQAREQFFDAQNIRSPVRNQTLPGFDRGSSTNSQRRIDGRGKSINLVA